jgi:hypothetical protein
LYCSSKNSIEFTTLELGCLACFGQLPLGVLLWSHAKQALNIVDSKRIFRTQIQVR